MKKILILLLLSLLLVGTTFGSNEYDDCEGNLGFENYERLSNILYNKIINLGDIVLDKYSIYTESVKRAKINTILSKLTQLKESTNLTLKQIEIVDSLGYYISCNNTNTVTVDTAAEAAAQAAAAQAAAAQAAAVQAAATQAAAAQAAAEAAAQAATQAAAQAAATQAAAAQAAAAQAAAAQAAAAQAAAKDYEIKIFNTDKTNYTDGDNVILSYDLGKDVDICTLYTQYDGSYLVGNTGDFFNDSLPHSGTKNIETYPKVINYQINCQAYGDSSSSRSKTTQTISVSPAASMDLGCTYLDIGPSCSAVHGETKKVYGNDSKKYNCQDGDSETYPTYVGDFKCSQGVRIEQIN